MGTTGMLDAASIAYSSCVGVANPLGKPPCWKSCYKEEVGVKHVGHVLVRNVTQKWLQSDMLGREVHGSCAVMYTILALQHE